MQLSREIFRGDKNHINVDFVISDSEDPKDLSVHLSVHFAGKYDPCFLNLAKAVVVHDIKKGCFDSVAEFVDVYLTSPSLEVPGDA